MSIFTLKIISCIAMIFDHIKYAIPQTDGIITQVIGRMAFPLFAFMAVEGYLHTSNLKKYILKLIIFGIISELPFLLFRTLVGPGVLINIMGTLVLGVISIFIYDKLNNKFIGFLAAVSIAIIGQFAKVDYGWFGVGLVFLIYLTRNHKLIFSITYILLVSIYYFSNYIPVVGVNFNLLTNCFIKILSTSLALIFMLLYNGKLGHKIKYFYYIFYPVHMLILYFISYINL